MSNNRELDRYIMVYRYSGISCNHENHVYEFYFIL